MSSRKKKDDRPIFSGGRNMALKVPPEQFDSTVAFYRDVLGLPMIDSLAPSIVFRFGKQRLWIDNVPTLSRSELWLEVEAADIGQAADWLQRHAITRRDGIEPLPEGFEGFWISSPSAVIHLVSREGQL